MLRNMLSFLAYGLIALGLVSLARASAMPIKAAYGQYRLDAVWQETLETGNHIKPWSSADFHLIGKLTIKRLGVSRIILSSASGEAMAWGVGRVIPVKNAPTGSPTILAGHRDTHMQFMSELQMGDRLELQLSDGYTKSYQITVSQISKTPELILQDQPGNYDKLILTTCWPFNAIQSGPERFIIIGEAT